MARLLRFCVLLLAVLFQIGLTHSAASETSHRAEQARGEQPVAPAPADSESSEDGSSERSAIDDAGDEYALSMSIAVRPSSSRVCSFAHGLARGLSPAGAPFKPPR